MSAPTHLKAKTAVTVDYSDTFSIAHNKDDVIVYADTSARFKAQYEGTGGSTAVTKALFDEVNSAAYSAWVAAKAAAVPKIDPKRTLPTNGADKATALQYAQRPTNDTSIPLSPPPPPPPPPPPGP